MIFDRLDDLAAQLRAMRPLNETELKRLRDEFVIEHTYDSNAIEGNTLILRETALILQAGLTIAEKPIKEPGNRTNGTDRAIKRFSNADDLTRHMGTSL